MRNFIFSIIFLLPSVTGNAQDITNTLGSSGTFSIKDNSNTFLSLSQSTGYLSLNKSFTLPVTTGSTVGVIYKSSDRFIHDFQTASGRNTFMGINSGNFTMTSGYNTAVGYYTLNALTSGESNSAFGVDVLKLNTTGERNSAMGYYSLPVNTTGSNNSTLGVQSLPANTEGSYNSAFGVQSMYSNTAGNHNSAFGYQSMIGNTTGNKNSAFGYYTLQGNQSGEKNSAFGYNSLFYCTGSNNSAFGVDAGTGISSGSNNIAIGNNAQVPVGTSSNQVRIGNTDITYAGVQVAWTITSDRRWKDNIQTSSLGLDFISKLNPVSYTRNNDEKQRTEFGLIAQDIEAALKEFNIENVGMLTIDDNGYYQLRYNDLLSPMIKAIQELRIKNEELKIENEKQITDLKNENGELKENLAKFEQIQEILIRELAILKLNINKNQNVTLSEVK